MKESKNVQEVLGEAVEALIKKDTEKFKEIVESDPEKTIKEYRVTKDTNLTLLNIIISKLKNVGVENVSLDGTFSAEGNYPLPIIAAYLNMPEIAQWLIEQKIYDYVHQRVTYNDLRDTSPFDLNVYGIKEYAALFGELDLLKTVILAESFVANKVNVLLALRVSTNKMFNEVVNLSLSDDKLKEVFKIGCYGETQQKILLKVAACASQIDICKFLMEQGVKLDLKAKENEKLTLFLVDKGYMDIINLLEPTQGLKSIDSKPEIAAKSSANVETKSIITKIKDQLVSKLQAKIKEIVNQDSLSGMKTTITKLQIDTVLSINELNTLIEDSSSAESTDTALTGETHDAVGDDAAV